MRQLILLTALVASAGVYGVAQTPPALPGERFENWLFRTPPGWTKREEVDGLTMTSPDGQATMKLLPGEPLSSAGLDTYLNGQLVLQERGLNLESAEAPQTTPTSDHYEWLVHARALTNAQGRRVFRAYFAANPRGRAELMILTASSQDALAKALPIVAAFVDSARFANVLGVPKVPPRPLPPVPAVSPGSVLAASRLEPIPEEFSCYVRQMSDDYSAPDFFLQILPGRQYRMATGSGSFVVMGGGSSVTGRVRWQSGPLATPASPNTGDGIIGWRDEGQLIILSEVPVGRGGAIRTVDCYQRGTREALAKATFVRLDPRPGSYRCITAFGKEPAGTLEILPGRRYRYGGTEGVYAVNVMDYQLEKLSELKFFGGPFDFGRGHYGDEPPGRQGYAISARVSLECQR